MVNHLGLRETRLECFCWAKSGRQETGFGFPAAPTRSSRCRRRAEKALPEWSGET